MDADERCARGDEVSVPSAGIAYFLRNMAETIYTDENDPFQSPRGDWIHFDIHHETRRNRRPVVERVSVPSWGLIVFLLLVATENYGLAYTLFQSPRGDSRFSIVARQIHHAPQIVNLKSAIVNRQSPQRGLFISYCRVLYGDGLRPRSVSVPSAGIVYSCDAEVQKYGGNTAVPFQSPRGD